jgi:hypothetical protein
MATLGVFIALGGTSYAALTITGRNVKDGSLGSRDIKDGRLLAKDFKAGQLPAGPQGAAGVQGDAGPTGPTGPQGPSGSAGRNGATTVVVRRQTADGARVAAEEVRCWPGERATGGGVETTTADYFVTRSEPVGSPPTGWSGEVTGAGVVMMEVSVVCASP